MKGPIPVEMNIQTEGWTARDTEGNLWPIDHLNLQTTYETETESLPLARHRYTGTTGEYAVASATANLGGVLGSFVMMQEGADSGASIYWVPDKPSGSA